jgi:hypothetical protein
MTATIHPWPNGLGWDLGTAEVWQLPREPDDHDGYPFGVRTFRAGTPHKYLRALLGSSSPTEAELRCLVARCRAHGSLITP